MKLDWTFNERKELEYDKPPSGWIAVAIIIFTCIAGAILTVLTWEKGQPVVSASFFGRALLAPMITGGVLCALVYSGPEDANESVDIYNYFCRRSRVRWLAWSQDRVAILESIALTPEKDLAERMLGLEGSAPRNEGRILPLHADDNGETDAPEGDAAVVLAGGRLETVLEKLVTPFLPYMARAAARHTFSILLQSDNAGDTDTLRTLLRRLDIPDAERIGIERPAQPFDAGVVHRWLNNEEKMQDFCLVLACQLHQEGAEAGFSEVAVGMLYAAERVIREFRGELKAQAWLVQPISAASDSVANALRDMLAAQRLPPESVGHFWLGTLPKQARHALKAAATRAGLSADVHDVEQAIGAAGPANALLTQALAAEMVQHGQGTQLVATSGGTGIVLNLVGVQQVPVPAEPEFELRYLTPIQTFGVTGICCLLVMLFGYTNAPTGMFAIPVGLLLLYLILCPIGCKARYDEIEDQFLGRSK